MDDAPDLGDTLDLDTGAAERVGDAGQLARAIRCQP
jgi:hypothetical protein